MPSHPASVTIDPRGYTTEWAGIVMQVPWTSLVDIEAAADHSSCGGCRGTQRSGPDEPSSQVTTSGSSHGAASPVAVARRDVDNVATQADTTLRAGARARVFGAQ